MVSVYLPVYAVLWKLAQSHAFPRVKCGKSALQFELKCLPEIYYLSPHIYEVALKENKSADNSALT